MVQLTFFDTCRLGVATSLALANDKVGGIGKLTLKQKVEEGMMAWLLFPASTIEEVNTTWVSISLDPKG